MSTALVSRMIVSGMGLIVGLCSCSRPVDAPVSPDFSIAVCQLLGVAGPTDPTCQPPDCGGNSPVVNGFPINGFSKDGGGACNPAGVQLLPRSLQGGGCGSGADLGFEPEGLRLVGRRDDEVVCTGEQLTGATFQVRSHARATLAFTIAGVRRFRVGGKDFEGYRIESGGGSACEPVVAQRVRHQLGLVGSTTPPADGAEPTAAGYEFGPNDDLVIAVDGPLYDSRDQTIRDTRNQWFNVACAGDALAKRSLLGLHVAENDNLNETSLRMLTANYCGKPYTVRGMKVEWIRALMTGAREARWTDGKAICIDTPRLMKLQVVDGETFPPTELPVQLQPQGCENRTCDEAGWTRALLAECRLARCRSETNFQIESFFHSTDINRVLVNPRAIP
jgi:hypothetical protein